MADLNMDARKIQQRTNNNKIPRRFAISPGNLRRDSFVYTKSGGKLTVELKKSPSSSSGCSSSSFLSKSSELLVQDESDPEMVVKEEVNEDGRINIKFIPNNNLVTPTTKSVSKVEEAKQRIKIDNNKTKKDVFFKYISPDGKIVILKNPNTEKPQEVKNIKKLAPIAPKSWNSNNQTNQQLILDENKTQFPVVYVKTEPLDGNEDYIEKPDYMPENPIREEPLATPEDIIKNVSFVLNQFNNTSEVNDVEYSTKDLGKETTGLSAPEDIIKNVSMVLNQFQDDLDLEEYRSMEVMDVSEEEKSSDASTQTESYGGMGELIEMINNQILGFQYKVFGREYKLDQCSLFFTQKIPSNNQSQTNRLNIAEVKVGKNLLESKNVAILKGMSISENFYKKRCSGESNDGLEGLSIKMGPSFEEIKRSGSNDKEKCSLEEIIQIKTDDKKSSSGDKVKENGKNEVIGKEIKGNAVEKALEKGYLVPLDDSLEMQRSLNSSMNKIGSSDFKNKSPQEILQKDRSLLSFSPPKKIMKSLKRPTDTNVLANPKNSEKILIRKFDLSSHKIPNINADSFEKKSPEKPFFPPTTQKRKIGDTNLKILKKFDLSDDKIENMQIYPTIDLLSMENSDEGPDFTDELVKNSTRKTKISTGFEPTFIRSGPNEKLLVYSKNRLGTPKDPLMFDKNVGMTEKTAKIPKKIEGDILKRKLLQKRPFFDKKDDEIAILDDDEDELVEEKSMKTLKKQQQIVVGKKSKKLPLRFKDNNTFSHVFLDKIFKKKFGLANARKRLLLNKRLVPPKQKNEEGFSMERRDYRTINAESAGTFELTQRRRSVETGERTYGRKRTMGSSNREHGKRCDVCKTFDPSANHRWRCYPKSVCTICRNLNLGRHDFGMGHLKKHERNGCFCKKCGTIFPRRHLRKHMESCVLPENGKIPFKDLFYVYSENEIICKLCKSLTFDSFKTFARHVGVCHSDRIRNYLLENKIVKKYRKMMGQKIKYKCRNCGYVSLNLKRKVAHNEICMNVLAKKNQ